MKYPYPTEEHTVQTSKKIDTPYLVGITGGSGAGKTVLLKALLESLGTRQVCFISQDNYYKPREEQPLDGNGVQNFDLPTSIDAQAYAKDIKALKEGNTIKLQEYTFNNDAATPQELTFYPAPIIIVEGIFVMYFEEVAKQLDLKVFIEAKPHIKLKRRILRDRDERGYPLEDVLYRFEKHVMPTYEKYILPFKDSSDLIIPNNTDFSKGLKVLLAYLKTMV